MTQLKSIPFDALQLWADTSDSDKSEMPPTPDDNDDGGDLPTEFDEGDDGGEDPMEFVLERLFWFQRGATVETISRKHNLPEDVVQECINDLIEEDAVEAAEVKFQSEVDGETKFDGYKLTSEFRKRLAREVEEVEAHLAIEAREKRV